MQLQEFEKAIEKNDFTVGESFWIGGWEFEVVNSKTPGKDVSGDEVVFRWELTRGEFVQIILDNHPEVEDPEVFFDWHEDDIMHRFRKGFDALVGECGATYETVMRDAISEAIEERQNATLDGADAEKIQGPGTIRCDGDKADPEPSPLYSNTCKEVDEK